MTHILHIDSSANVRGSISKMLAQVHWDCAVAVA